MVDLRITKELDDKMQVLLHPPSSTGANTQWKEILQLLTANGLSYVAKLHPDELLVHPENRNRLGLNYHNAHKNGDKIVKAGADLDLLNKASLVAFQTHGSLTL